jgi:hypothetical protein
MHVVNNFPIIIEERMMDNSAGVTQEPFQCAFISKNLRKSPALL